VTRSPEDRTLADLVPVRLALLERETENLHNARRILADMRASGAVDRRTWEEAQRAVRLAEEAQRLGVRDAYRAGARTAEVAAAAQIDEASVSAIVSSTD
jgi:hypothetical protein